MTGGLTGGSYALPGPQVSLRISVQVRVEEQSAFLCELKINLLQNRSHAGIPNWSHLLLPLDFADLSLMICVGLARHLTCVPAAPAVSGAPGSAPTYVGAAELSGRRGRRRS